MTKVRGKRHIHVVQGAGGHASHTCVVKGAEGHESHTCGEGWLTTPPPLPLSQVLRC